MGSVALALDAKAERIALPLAGLACICAIVVVAYWSSFAGMASMWALSSFGHGFVIPLVAVVLIWRKRHAFATKPWTGSWLGVAALAGSVWLWLIARATMVQAVEYFAVVAMINATVWAVAGTAAYRALLFPLAFLFCSLPVGDSLIPILMQVTADISASALQAMGIPVLREGMIVTLPHGTFEVADVCSGFGYVNTGIALGALVAHELLDGLGRRILYVLAVIFVFVLTNGLRAFIVMMVASATEMRVFAGPDHVYFGWLLFLIVSAGMYMVAERFSNRRPRGGA